MAMSWPIFFTESVDNESVSHNISGLPLVSKPACMVTSSVKVQKQRLIIRQWMYWYGSSSEIQPDADLIDVDFAIFS